MKIQEKVEMCSQLFDSLCTETMYSLNMKIVLMELYDEDIEKFYAIVSFIHQCEKGRTL